MSLIDTLTALEPAEKLAKTAWLRALELTAPIASNAGRLLPHVIDELAQIHSDAPALLSDRQCLSFRELSEQSHRYSRWALDCGVSKGDVVALLMPNRPEYVALWLGVTRVGGIVALLNTNLRGAALAHCINVVKAQFIIVATEYSDEFDSARPHLADQPQTWFHGGDHDRSLDQAIQRHSGAALTDVALPPVGINDVALYIYTSGTTGLPKAAKVSHRRLLQWSHWFAGMMDVRRSDRMYNCLPMYHSIGGVVAIGAILVKGGSVIVRETFSVRQFWDDIARWDCTLFQYIGELCRYLVNAEPHPTERNHRIRLCCGNGLRPDIWNDFQSRFAIPQILEFYASTEGTFSLYNVEGKPGAIGRIPPFLAHRFPVAMVRFDHENGEPLRSPDGLCIRCGANEVGEAIGRISGRTEGSGSSFEGYTDARESDRKILRHVFEAGDAWFRTGDLMRRDERGYFYFVDRVGDTFRWKGENVSTTEVAEVMMNCPGIMEANVFGVAVPGTDGRAGMAAIVTRGDFEPARLRNHLDEHLPRYARPLFIRIRNELDVTPTFKHKKNELALSGFDPAQTPDPIYFNDEPTQSWVRIDANLYRRLQGGAIRL